MRKRKILDAVMVITLVYLCGSGLAGSRIESLLHEWSGIIFFLCVVLHLVWNRKWISEIFKGKYSANRKIGLVINFSLIITILFIIVSSIMISGYVFAFLNLSGAFAGRRMHMVATAWIMPLAALHLGAHHINSKRNVLWYLLAFGGAVSFVMTRYYDRMFLLSEFPFVPDYPVFVQYLFGLLIFILFAVAGAELAKIISKKKKEK